MEDTINKLRSEIERSVYVYRGVNPLEIKDFDNQGNFFLEGKRVSALHPVTPDGKDFKVEDLPNPGFSVTLGKTTGVFGGLTLQFAISDIKNLGGRVLPTSTEPDYFYVEIPDGKKIKGKLVHGHETIAKIGALQNILAGAEKKDQYVIAPLTDSEVTSGYRLKNGNLDVTCKREADRIVITKMSDNLNKNPRLFHSFILAMLIRTGVRFGHFEVNEIVLPNGKKYQANEYFEPSVMAKMKQNPNSLQINDLVK